MLHPVIVLGGVLVLRRVAASDVAAFEAESEMHPAVADGQALLAAVRRVRFALILLWSDGTKVRAVGHGVCSLVQRCRDADHPYFQGLRPS